MALSRIGTWGGCWGLLAGVAAHAQQPAAPVLLPAPTSLPLAGPLALGFRVAGAGPVSYAGFPDIEGFRKGTVRKATTTRLLPGGQRRAEQTITQQYFPYAEGDFVLPAFDLTVNGQLLHSPAAQVHVGPAAPAAPGSASASVGSSTATGSLDQLLGRPKPRNFTEPPDHAYLSLEADQPRVYAGQGVHIGLYLYLRPEDQALLRFYDFTNQLTQLRQQLRQPTAWQAPAPDPAVLPDTVRRAGQPVQLRFRLADYTYYPLTPQPLRFPSLSLTLIKTRLLKHPEPGDDAQQPFYKTYRSQPVQVAVQPLPPTAGPPPAAVGTYTLHESLSTTSPRTSQAFSYVFGVEGAGNPAAVVPTAPAARPGLEVYGPEVSEAPLAAGRWRKNFRYRLVARRPGPVPLDSLLQLPFFNPELAHYDTLRPSLRPVARGSATAAATAQLPADDPFYGPALGSADTHLQPLDVYRQVTRYAGWLLAGLLAVAAAGAWRSRGR